jgi:hypothetical protein
LRRVALKQAEPAAEELETAVYEQRVVLSMATALLAATGETRYQRHVSLREMFEPHTARIRSLHPLAARPPVRLPADWHAWMDAIRKGP